MKWLLLRGLARQQKHWGPFHDMLKEQKSVDEVLCLDLPGFGEELNEESPMTIADNVEHVRERWLEVRSEDEDWGIFAISLGGMIAMDWLGRFPKDFKSATILNTSAANYSVPWKRFKAYNFIHPHILKDSDWTPRDKERLILATVSNQFSHNEKVLDDWESIYNEAPYDPVNVARQLAGAAIYQCKPGRIHVPTLFLCSAQDRLVDCSCTLKIAKDVREAHINIHPTAGHELALDAPEWVCEKMSRHFS